ncbi:carbohydrate ABC transporter permease [Gynuella sunshinyii]|uniref:ABC-type sugar transport system, permease component n=1 Tax=Gynuella sunshinyii YC6258 TaxID=1445510 RepID=A0A0C5VII2_9GAMM|nr:sugar ABC transporter permease [Gynuella sunshinyii]AJQ93158.1 ABC-type sugar transport system, permease component [Gynuella sunshinyii YC6258]
MEETMVNTVTETKKNNRTSKRIQFSALLASTPMMIVAVGVFVICVSYSVLLSFTRSRLFPNLKWVGLDQYERLWGTSRWIMSVENLFIYGVLFIAFCLLSGFLMAVFLDQKVRFESTFRTLFLYPYAMSLVVTGLIWQWMMEPSLGIQNVIQKLGWESFHFAPLVDPQYAIYGVLIAAVWQSSGLVMAIMLAGLRGIDEQLWKATRVDGIPPWKVYLFIILPMIRPVIVTSVVLLAVGVVRVYDLIVAQTGGGPGMATEMPAKFVIDHITQRANVGLGMAAATMMLLPVLVVIGPWIYREYVRPATRQGG